jgi:hypothetical protein
MAQRVDATRLLDEARAAMGRGDTEQALDLYKSILAIR